MKVSKSKSPIFSTSLKWATIPIVFAVLLRYAPGYFYGNKRVLEKPIAYEIIDDFLTESDVLDLREWVFNERRFATVIDAAARGVQSIGEDEPIKPDGTCDDMTFTASPSSPTCKFTGRSDIAQHFVKTGGHRGMKETPDKLISSTLSFINYYPDKVNDPAIKKLFENKEYLVSSFTNFNLTNKLYVEKSRKHLPRWLGNSRATKRRRLHLSPYSSQHRSRPSWSRSASSSRQPVVLGNQSTQPA